MTFTFPYNEVRALEAIKEMYRALDSDEILEKVADLIQQGWMQGSLGIKVDGQELLCLLGAINKTCTGDTHQRPQEGDRNYPAYTEALKRLRVAIDAKLQERLGDSAHILLGYDRYDTRDLIAATNDAPETTQEDILLLVKQALTDQDTT